MANKLTWCYEKLNEKGNIERIYSFSNDADGKITGKIVMNVKAYFDENPEERKRLGWIKHLQPSPEGIQYNKQTQFLMQSTRQIDPWTIEDVFYVMDKSEDQLYFEEMLAVVEGTAGGGGLRVIDGGFE